MYKLILKVVALSSIISDYISTQSFCEKRELFNNSFLFVITPCHFVGLATVNF